MILKNVFSIYSVRQMKLWPCKNCIKTQQLKNRRDLYIPVLSPYNYHVKVKCKSLYQFLINITLSISIRQIFEVLKQRLSRFTISSAIWLLVLFNGRSSRFQMVIHINCLCNCKRSYLDQEFIIDGFNE